MEAERSRPEPTRDDPAPEDEPGKEKTLPRVASGPTRCPFCHVSVDVAAQEWVACESCLARHHASCWRDHGSCSSCGATRVLTRAPSSAPRSRVAQIAISLGVTSIVIAVVSLALSWSILRKANDLYGFAITKQQAVEERLTKLEAAKSAPTAPVRDEQAYAEASLAEHELVRAIEGDTDSWIETCPDHAKDLLNLAAIYDRAARGVDAHAIEDARRLRAASADAIADRPRAVLARLAGLSLEALSRHAVERARGLCDLRETKGNSLRYVPGWLDLAARELEFLERPADAKLCRDLARAFESKAKSFDDVRAALDPLVKKLSD